MIIGNSSVIAAAIATLRDNIVNHCKLCGGNDPACKCRFKLMIYENVAQANAPISLITKTFSDFGKGQEDNEIIADLKEKWKRIIYDISDVIKNGKIIIVSGPNGTGKTMMSVIAMKSAVASRYSTQYILFNGLIDAFMNHKEEVNEIIFGTDMLVLDEVGKEYKKVNQFGQYDTSSNIASYAKFVLEHVVKTRFDAGLATFIITNYTSKEMDAIYGGSDSAISSVFCSHRTEKIYHTGFDFRGLNV